MQPVTIIRVQTPVCAVPGVLLPVRGHCAVRGVRDAHVSRPCTATPVLSCHDVLAVAADLFTPPCSEPRRATSPRKKKENRRAAHRAARRTHAPLCFAPFVLPPLAGPFFLQRGAGGWRQSPRFPARLFTQQTERAGLVPPFRWPVFCVCCWDSYCCGSWVSFSLTSHRQFGRRMLC